MGTKKNNNVKELIKKTQKGGFIKGNFRNRIILYI